MPRLLSAASVRSKALFWQCTACCAAIPGARADLIRFHDYHISHFTYGKNFFLGVYWRLFEVIIVSNIIMTAYSGQILGPIAKFLGIIMNGIFDFLTEVLGIENGSIALSIIIFTILCLLVLEF